MSTVNDQSNTMKCLECAAESGHKAWCSLAPATGSVSWEDCERKFREMTAAFGKDMPKYRKLGAEYDAMLEAYERTQETPNEKGQR